MIHLYFNILLYIFNIYINLKRIFTPERPIARSPRGGPTMGRPAEWRPALVELADASVSATDATIPPSPRGARPMTGRGSGLYTPRVLDCAEEMAVG